MAGKVLGEAVEWQLWTQLEKPKRLFKEAIFSIPGTKDLMIHLFMISPDGAGLNEVNALLEKLRLEETR